MYRVIVRLTTGDVLKPDTPPLEKDEAERYVDRMKEGLLPGGLIAFWDVDGDYLAVGADRVLAIYATTKEVPT